LNFLRKRKFLKRSLKCTNSKNKRIIVNKKEKKKNIELENNAKARTSTQQENMENPEQNGK
jgi:hypothetical protein